MCWCEPRRHSFAQRLSGQLSQCGIYQKRNMPLPVCVLFHSHTGTGGGKMSPSRLGGGDVADTSRRPLVTVTGRRPAAISEPTPPASSVSGGSRRYSTFVSRRISTIFNIRQPVQNLNFLSFLHQGDPSAPLLAPSALN